MSKKNCFIHIIKGLRSHFMVWCGRVAGPGLFSLIRVAVFLLLTSNAAIGQSPPNESAEDSIAVERYIDRVLDYRQKGEYYTALATLDSALIMAAEDHNERGTLRLLIQTSIIRHMLNDFDVALDLLFRAERIAEDHNDRNALAEINNNIGAIYHTQHEFFKAAEYYNRSIDIYLELDKRKEIGRAYNNFGVLWQDKKEPITALDYHRRSLAIWEVFGDEGWVGVTNMHIGVCHKLMGNLDSAVFYLKQSARTIERRKDRITQSMIYAELGDALMRSGNFGSAAHWCMKGLELSTELGSNIFQYQNCECLFEAYENMGEKGKALKYYKLYTALRDSSNNEQKLKEMTRIEMDHAFAQKQFADSIQRSQEQVLVELKHQEELANERADRNIAMGIGIGVLLLAGALWSRLRYVRKAQRMIKEERDRSEQLLLNILPAEIAAELKQNGKAKAKRYDEVTILFTDFEQFTATAAKMPPADLVDEINQCFTRFDEICERHGIEKIKTVGDAYMAAGGIPVSDDRAAIKVLRAALDMQEFIVNRAAEREVLSLPAFRMRAGVHTGPVVAGIVGTKKFQYDIWGDSVNTASRIESSSQIDQVSISEATYQLVQQSPEFRFSARGKVAAKGKGTLEMFYAHWAQTIMQ